MVVREFATNSPLDDAALAKVRDSRYTQVASQWKLTQQQHYDMLRRNRTYFATIVKALLKNLTVNRQSKK